MTRRATRSLLLLAAVVISTPAFAGTVTGKIVYDGSIPKLRPIAMDAQCAAKHAEPVSPRVLAVGEGGGLGNVFIQVKGTPKRQYPTPDEPLIIDQKGCLYEPRVAGAMIGQTVKFKNSDGLVHNVHGQPEVNAPFNIVMPPILKERDQVFDKPEPVFPVKCDVHPWMKAYVAVMTHPYFAVTGTDGTFRIPNVPAGTYEVEAWHERLGTQTLRVTVGAGAAAADFTFQRPPKQ